MAAVLFPVRNYSGRRQYFGGVFGRFWLTYGDFSIRMKKWQIFRQVFLPKKRNLAIYIEYMSVQ